MKHYIFKIVDPTLVLAFDGENRSQGFEFLGSDDNPGLMLYHTQGRLEIVREAEPPTPPIPDRSLEERVSTLEQLFDTLLQELGKIDSTPEPKATRTTRAKSIAPEPSTPVLDH